MKQATPALRLDTALDSFMRQWGRLQVDDDMMRSFTIRPLDSDARLALQLIGDVETNSVAQLGNAFAIGIADHPGMSEFLSRWSAEEAEHGQTFRRIAAAGASQTTPERILLPIQQDRILEQRRKRSFAQRNSRKIVSVAAKTIPRFDAIYSVFGAIQEYSVVRAYGLLAQRSADERLALVLNRVLEQERRHYRVYYAFATDLLSHDRLAQRVVQTGLRYAWKPVGYEAMGAANWQWLCRYLCPSQVEVDWFADVDRIIDLLPGLQSHNVMRRWIEDALGPT